ncbi:hypothetical protein CDAR_68011 [Caerostris darwini]|uniref:Cytochrome c biogenesis B n=1 Tax=Caerostris darwini TaxID=1538125 RepID=A0AAV4VRH7_9ARAC|nr:hypothetical protein CDAR_68011 [Caerostris darwini]
MGERLPAPALIGSFESSGLHPVSRTPSLPFHLLLPDRRFISIHIGSLRSDSLLLLLQSGITQKISKPDSSCFFCPPGLRLFLLLGKNISTRHSKPAAVHAFLGPSVTPDPAHALSRNVNDSPRAYWSFLPTPLLCIV